MYENQNKNHDKCEKNVSISCDNMPNNGFMTVTYFTHKLPILQGYFKNINL